MINVSNHGCIRRLSRKTLSAARTRNLIAILAIALTTVLFTSLFTIGMSINDGFQQANFRQAGGYAHGSFKYLTEEQFHELKDDSKIQDYGLRRFLGMPTGAPFQKSHVEVSYCDANTAHWMFCDPITGRLPQENTMEAATDLHVLELLGVEPEIGSQFTLTFDVDGHETTQTFTLCGWWEYDEAIIANHVLIPESRVDQILQEVGVDPENSSNGMTGSWNMDVMLSSSLHIERDLDEILSRHGYQATDLAQRDTYISTGVNWGYSGAQLVDSMDAGAVLAISAVLLLIILTGYLIIYNVFQISVSNDIRFYGLLKTIGTTPKQLRRIIRHQALFLSLVGIPIGLLAGWLVGAKLTPKILDQLNGVMSIVSMRPAIFVGAALFSLLTVLLSCARPGRKASKVSPIEAVRYTEGGTSSKRAARSNRSVSLVSMAWANLGRSRSKTVVTVLSLSLSVVLLTLTVTFTAGFDMDKYLSKMVSADYVVSGSDYFQSFLSGGFFTADDAFPQDAVDTITAQDGIIGGARIYGKTSPIVQFVTEERYRSANSRWNDPETLDWLVKYTDHDEEGNIAEDVMLYGMEDFALDHLELLEGDLSGLYQPGSHSIAAVYHADDYGNPVESSNWAKLGDTVKLWYVEEYEYYNPVTGEVYGATPPEDDLFSERTAKYREETYTVTALVCVPISLSYRYSAYDEFVMNAQTFTQDSGTSDILLYAFDVEDAANTDIDAFLADYTEDSPYDYESKLTYQEEFDGFQSMFLLLGGALSFIVGLVGILNFFNAILTGILTRKREFAVLQSIGMTGRQLKRMLVCEGLFYALGSVLFALCLILALSPLLSNTLEQLIWFFTYHFTISPILILAPIFTLLGCLVPLGVYRVVAKATIVERLREAES